MRELKGLVLVLLAAAGAATPAAAQGKKPNILVIFGDDVGLGDVSVYSHGLIYVVPTQEVVAQFLSTFKEYPPRQKPASFSVDQIIEKFLQATTPKSQ